jgi:hypothetical protein
MLPSASTNPMMLPQLAAADIEFGKSRHRHSGAWLGSAFSAQVGIDIHRAVKNANNQDVCVVCSEVRNPEVAEYNLADVAIFDGVVSLA